MLLPLLDPSPPPLGLPQRPSTFSTAHTFNPPPPRVVPVMWRAGIMECDTAGAAGREGARARTPAFLWNSD